jgi:prepilin-type N-terminal cleavage/methylation domain-containing protein
VLAIKKRVFKIFLGEDKMMLKAKQKGFTLLELLVVITLLAILSVGALVAYEGIGDTAQATAAANNTAKADQAIRNYKAVTLNYPDQWDNLVENTTGGLPAFAKSEVMGNWLASLPIAVPAAAGDGMDRLILSLRNVGVTELQTRVAAAATAGVEPNLQHNEGALGANAADVQEEAFVDGLSATPNTLAGGALATDFVAILPTFGDGAACLTQTAAITPPANRLDGVAMSQADQQRQNAINDKLEDDQCNLVVALGFGHDAAHSTTGSQVAISTAPTFVSKNINPNENYARYVALFHVAADSDEDGTIQDTEVFEKARLIAVVDTEGRAIDENIAASTDQTAN